MDAEDFSTHSTNEEDRIGYYIEIRGYVHREEMIAEMDEKWDYVMNRAAILSQKNKKMEKALNIVWNGPLSDKVDNSLEDKYAYFIAIRDIVMPIKSSMKVVDTYYDTGYICFALDTGEVKRYAAYWALSSFSTAKSDFTLQALMRQAIEQTVVCVHCQQQSKQKFPDRNKLVCTYCELVCTYCEIN